MLCGTFLDATLINVRKDSAAKVTMYIIIGITEDGHEDILDYRVYPHEGASN